MSAPADWNGTDPVPIWYAHADATAATYGATAAFDGGDAGSIYDEQTNFDGGSAA